MSEPTDDERVGAVIAKDSGEELAGCKALLSFALAEWGAWSGRPIKRGADRIVLAEAARGTKTFGAVIRLCEAGFGEQALMLDRSLFEGMAVAHWVAANRRESVRLFTRHAKLNALLTFETLDGLGWLAKKDRQLRPTVSPKRRKELVGLFGAHGTRPWLRRNVWTILGEIERQWDEKGRTDLWNFHKRCLSAKQPNASQYGDLRVGRVHPPYPDDTRGHGQPIESARLSGALRRSLDLRAAVHVAR